MKKACIERVLSFKCFIFYLERLILYFRARYPDSQKNVERLVTKFTDLEVRILVYNRHGISCRT